MTLKTRALLLDEANENLPDNISKDVSPADVRNLIKNIIDSFVSKYGDTGIQDVLRYSSSLTLSDSKDLAYKGYVDAKISDDAYGIGWDTSLEGATKNTLYDKIETLLLLDGSKAMTGDLDLNLNDIVDIVNIKQNSLIAIDLAAKRLYDDTELSTLDWDLCFYGDKLGVISCNWNTRLYYNSAGVLVIDYDDLRLFDSSSALSIDWQVRGLVNVAGNAYIVKWDSTDAALEVNSTTKPFLPPRMDTGQKNAISGPVAGSIVFDTTLNKLCVYGASSWETITSI